MTSQTNPGAIAFPLKRVKTHAPVNDGLVQILEGMLQNAKEGKLQSAAFACVWANDLEPGGSTSEGWHMAPFTNYALSHAMGQLNHRIKRALYGD